MRKTSLERAICWLTWGSRHRIARESARYSEPLPDAFRAVAQAAGIAATPGIRNAATVGGNLLQR
ncbi:MAG: hypothetical protein AAF479_13155, partial [Pseudomonadota bacterium]